MTDLSNQTLQSNPLTRFVDAKWKVLAICFLVTGFLGIPLVFMCQRMSTIEKWMWSFVITVYTLALLAGAAFICYWSYLQIQSSFA